MCACDVMSKQNLVDLMALQLHVCRWITLQEKKKCITYHSVVITPFNAKQMRFSFINLYFAVCVCIYTSTKNAKRELNHMMKFNSNVIYMHRSSKFVPLRGFCLVLCAIDFFLHLYHIYVHLHARPYINCRELQNNFTYFLFKKILTTIGR